MFLKYDQEQTFLVILKLAVKDVQLDIIEII